MFSIKKFIKIRYIVIQQKFLLILKVKIDGGGIYSKIGLVHQYKRLIYYKNIFIKQSYLLEKNEWRKMK